MKYPLEEEIEVRLIGLITTWDVLKWVRKGEKEKIKKRLITTWDVLKLFQNFHAIIISYSLITTWDVLKYK